MGIAYSVFGIRITFSLLFFFMITAIAICNRLSSNNSKYTEYLQILLFFPVHGMRKR